MAINNETLFKQPARMFDGVNLVLCSTRPGRFDPGEYYLTNGDHFVIFLAHSGNTTLEPGKPTGEDFDSEDDRALGPGLLWPVGSHPARETFDKGLGSCILELAVEAGLRPASVGLYRQGHGPPTDDEQCPVTILVILFLHPSEYTMETLGGFIAPMPELIKHAESFVDMVHNILDELEHPDVHIEVVAGTQQGSWDLPCEEHRFDDVLHPGCSIGIEGLDTCCSLSGLVRVTMPNDYTGVYGLMSHYMAGYGRRNRMLPIREEEQVRILSPARTDHETTMDALESYLPSGVKDMTRGRRDMNTWPAQEVVQHGEPNAYTESKKQLDDLLGEIHACNSRWLATRQLGPVCLSSGAKVPPPNTPMMDWALIDLEKSRIPGPGLISEAAQSRATEAAGLYNWLVPGAPKAEGRPGMLSFAISAHETVVPVERIRELCQITPPTTVYVHGRVTTVGRGILHDAQDMVADVYSEYPPGTRSTEFVLLPKPELGISPFACAGEVGAPIRLEDGSLVGFVRFRSYRTIQGGCQIYVTPAELVLKDIAESLQAKDVLFIPCWNEEAGADGSG